MSHAVCSKCIDDFYLKKIIKEKAVVGACSSCHDTRGFIISVEELGKLIEPVLKELYEEGDDYKQYHGDDDRGSWAQHGEDMSYLVEEVLGQYFDFQDDIVDAVINSENVWPQDGEYNYWDTSQSYVSRRFYRGLFDQKWKMVLEELKHTRRFFNDNPKALFEQLFGDVDSLKTRGRQPVVYNLPLGETLYRARVITNFSLNDIFTDPFKYIGPPPCEFSRAGRMNPEGISVLYTAFDKKTCLAEMRPALGNELAVISLQTTRVLRVLDLTRLEKVRGRKELSYFQPDYINELEKGIFLRNVHRIVSQPVAPGQEVNYLITQALAEYLAYAHEKPFDGIVFASAQRGNGRNLVVFGAKDQFDLVLNEDRFGIQFVADSLQLFCTKSINYCHDEVKVIVYGNGDVHRSQIIEDD